jgi:hypothetical protein
MKVFSTLALSAALCGCSGMGPKFQPIPGDGQELRTSKATSGEVLQSKGSNALVRLEQVSNDNLEDYGAVFAVTVYNSGEASFMFGPESISVSQGGSVVGLLTPERIQQVEKTKASQRSFLSTLAMVGSVAAGVASSSYAYEASNYNQAALEAASQSATASMVATVEATSKYDESASKAAEARESLFHETALKSKPVEAGETHGGFFVVEKPSAAPLVFEISTNGQRHELRFEPK